MARSGEFKVDATVLAGVEKALRSQKGAWRELALRIGRIRPSDLPQTPPKRVLLFGVGSSLHAAALSLYCLKRDRGHPRPSIEACSSTELGHGVWPGSGDWAIAISHRGTSEATLKALELARLRGAYTMLVGCKGVDAPAGVDFILETCTREEVEPHTVSLTSAVCAITGLLGGPRFQDRWVRMANDPDPSGMVGDQAVPFPTAILGEWEGEWLAREAALKIAEMAGVAVRSYPSEQYFHGPRAALGERDSLWWINSPGDGRAKDLTELTSESSRVDLADPTDALAAWVPGLVELQWRIWYAASQGSK